MNVLTKAKIKLWMFAHFKVPLIGYTAPTLIRMDEQELVLKIKFRRKTKNHLNSMYLGALVIGADVASGMHAVYFTERSGKKVSLAFKSMSADFIKRPQKDVYFVCKHGQTVESMIEQSSQSRERVTQNIPIEAFTDYPENPEKIATFEMGLSVRVK